MRTTRKWIEDLTRFRTCQYCGIPPLPSVRLCYLGTVPEMRGSEVSHPRVCRGTVVILQPSSASYCLQYLSVFEESENKKYHLCLWKSPLLPDTGFFYKFISVSQPLPINFGIVISSLHLALLGLDLIHILLPQLGDEALMVSDPALCPNSLAPYTCGQSGIQKMLIWYWSWTVRIIEVNIMK